MITYTPADTFTETDIYDLSDLVIGGTGGVSNTPLKALLDRTNFLYNRLVSFEGIKLSAGSYPYDVADTRKHFVFHLSNNATFSLPAVGTLRVGKIIPIRAIISGIKALTVQCSGTELISGGGIFGQDVSAMFMHNCESLFLEAAGDHWEVLHADGNFYMGIGETFGGRVVGKNMIIAQGQIVNRADVPRLNEFVSGLTNFQQVLDDGIWLSDPGGDPIYRSCYSYGNGTTTIRIPDERGLFERYLDLGRGIDNDRIHNYAGGLELDQFKSHKHNVSEIGDKNLDPVPTYRAVASNTDGATGLDIDIKMKTAGGSETRPKNIGKIPLIRF